MLQSFLDSLKQLRPRFGLRDLMILVLAAAVGLMSHEHPMRTVYVWAWKEPWLSALLAGVSLFFLFGLAGQAWDTWHGYRAQSVMSPDERWGWRFAVFWRLALVLLITGLHIAV